MKILHCDGIYNPADLLTKWVDVTTLHRLRDRLLGHLPIWGPRNTLTSYQSEVDPFGKDYKEIFAVGQTRPDSFVSAIFFGSKPKRPKEELDYNKSNKINIELLP